MGLVFFPAVLGSSREAPPRKGLLSFELRSFPLDHQSEFGSHIQTVRDIGK